MAKEKKKPLWQYLASLILKRHKFGCISCNTSFYERSFNSNLSSTSMKGEDLRYTKCFKKILDHKISSLQLRRRCISKQ